MNVWMDAWMDEWMAARKLNDGLRRRHKNDTMMWSPPTALTAFERL